MIFAEVGLTLGIAAGMGMGGGGGDGVGGSGGSSDVAAHGSSSPAWVSSALRTLPESGSRVTLWKTSGWLGCGGGTTGGSFTGANAIGSVMALIDTCAPTSMGISGADGGTRGLLAIHSDSSAA